MENITVIGIGRLGLGFALMLERKGFNICGVDTNQNYVNSLNNKIYKTKEPEYETLIKESKNFFATTSLQEGLDFSNTVFLLVPTPNSGGDKFYDHTILSNLLVSINKLKPQNKDIIIGCTVIPKYIDTIGSFLLEDCENCFLSYNPEFVAQGSIISGFSKPDIILVGTNNPSLEPKIRNIYDKMCDNNPKYCFISPLESEIVKISLNGYITTKISFANMISDACDTLGADKHKVLDSIGGDSRIGNKYFKPGNSYGGPCFPRDTKALQMFIDQTKINSDLLIATTLYNDLHIDFQVKQMLDLNLDTYVIENVCFKKSSKIPLIEESARLKIAKKLVENGKKVIIKDEIQLVEEVRKEFGNIFKYQTI